MINRRLIVSLAALAASVWANHALAQGAFPAPLPGQAAPANDPAFPPVNGSAPSASMGSAPSSPFPSAGAAPIAGPGFGRTQAPPPSASAAAGDDCMGKFTPLRQEAERRGNLIKAASERHAAPDEACKLIGSFTQAEVKMIKFIETNSARCGIPPQILEQMKTGHKGSEALQKKVCAAAQQMQARAPAGPSLSDVLGSSASIPEATPTKKGGSTFDTLSGNALTR